MTREYCVRCFRSRAGSGRTSSPPSRTSRRPRGVTRRRSAESLDQAVGGERRERGEFGREHRGERNVVRASTACRSRVRSRTSASGSTSRRIRSSRVQRAPRSTGSAPRVEPLVIFVERLHVLHVGRADLADGGNAERQQVAIRPRRIALEIAVQLVLAAAPRPVRRRAWRNGPCRYSRSPPRRACRWPAPGSRA